VGGGRNGRVFGIAVAGFTPGGMTGGGPDGGGVGVTPAARIGGRVDCGGALLEVPADGRADVDVPPLVVDPLVVLVPPAGDGAVGLGADVERGVVVPPGVGRGARGRQYGMTVLATFGPPAAPAVAARRPPAPAAAAARPPPPRRPNGSRTNCETAWMRIIRKNSPALLLLLPRVT
jgi:hypothetical protein